MENSNTNIILSLELDLDGEFRLEGEFTLQDLLYLHYLVSQEIQNFDKGV